MMDVGYSDYVMSASSSLVDMMTSAAAAAGSSASSVAGQVTAIGQTVADSVSEVCQVAAQSAQQRLLSYKYEPGSRPLLWSAGETETEDSEPVFPVTDNPVWLLGQQFSARYDVEDLQLLVSSKPWLSYRKDFPTIGSSGLTSDQGWGCMLRCGQMVLAGALLDIKLGKGWRWDKETRNIQYWEVMARFVDVKSAQYSIHQIALMGESVDKKPVGTWFGPNTVAQVLRKLCLYDPNNDLAVHVAMDNTLVLQEVRQTCLIQKNDVQIWRPLLLFISLRLGLSEINPLYVEGLKASLELPHTLGVIGGRPNHALYLLGYVEDEVIFLDPHTTQPAVTLDSWEENKSQDQIIADSSYHAHRPGRISINQLDPSLSLCFLCKTEQDFDNLCISIQERLVEGCKTPLFEILIERPPHLFSQHLQAASSDCTVQPDETTGQDYEQVGTGERKFDSEDEFEII